MIPAPKYDARFVQILVKYISKFFCQERRNGLQLMFKTKPVLSLIFQNKPNQLELQVQLQSYEYKEPFCMHNAVHLLCLCT